MKKKQSEEKIILTRIQTQVLKLICREYSSHEIGVKLGINVRTVETYRQMLYEKIKAKNSIGLFKYALKNNLYTVK